MSVARCPRCGASLDSYELDEGRCGNCMSSLPSRYSSDPVASWSRPEPPRRDEPDYRRPDPDDYDRPYPSRDRYDDDPYDTRRTYRDPARWSQMRTGVGMLFWGLVLIALAAILGLATAFMGSAVGGREGRDVAAVLGFLVLGVVVIAGLLMFIGTCLCCTIPAESGGRGWAIGLIILMVVNFLFQVGQFFLVAMPRGFMPGREAEMIAMGVILLGVGVSFATSLCFFMVMRAAARYWGGYGLGGNFVTYFVVYWIVPLVAGVFFVLVNVTGEFRGRDREVFGMLTGCGTLIFGVILFVWLLTLFSRLRSVIPSASSGFRRRSSDDY